MTEWSFNLMRSVQTVVPLALKVQFTQSVIGLGFLDKLQPSV